MNKPSKDINVTFTSGCYKEKKGSRLWKDGCRYWPTSSLFQSIGFAKVIRDLTECKELKRFLMANTLKDVPTERAKTHGRNLQKIAENNGCIITPAQDPARVQHLHDKSWSDRLNELIIVG